MPLARYVRLLCHAPQGAGPGGGYYRVGELEMRTTSGGTNLCTGGTAFGNSDYYPASRAFDGSVSDAANVWAGNPGDGRTLGYDFGSAVEVNFVRVRNSDTPYIGAFDQHVRVFDVQTSLDGTTWATARAVTDHPGATSAEVEYSIKECTFQGTVLDTAGAPCARTVRAYRRDTGELAGSTVSDSGTGSYSISSWHSGPHTLVFLPTTGESLNALVLDNVEGV